MPETRTAAARDGGKIERPVLVVQPGGTAPGGHFCKALEREGAALTTLRPDRGDPLPAGPGGFDALVVLGGSFHAYDACAFFAPLMDLMLAFEAAGRPVAGICLGGQLLARAHGARVWRTDDPEFGYVRLRPTALAREDPVLGPALPLPELMQYHQDTFDLPEGAELLVEGDRCANQCFRLGGASYGFQFHLEAEAATVARWIGHLRTEGIESLKAYRERYDRAFLDALAEGLPRFEARAEAFCGKVARRWLMLRA